MIDRVMWALASIVVLAVGIKLVAGGSIANAVVDVQQVLTPRSAATPSETRPPDVVVVLLDGFPGDAAAKLATGAGSPYDPEAFPDALTALGFHVQRNSHSNYLLTPMTLASMFEMRHLVDIPGLVADHGAGGQGRVFRQVLNDSAGLEILHRNGYELIWVDGGFNHTEVRRVDRWLDPVEPNELDVRMLASTTLGRVVSNLAPDLLSELQRRRILETLDDIPGLIDEPHDRPRFVFVHVPSPHAPWVFGPDGQALTESMSSFYADNVAERGIDRDEAMRRVFGQATFIARQVTDELKALVDRADPPAVIVFSDHGPGTNLSFTDPGSTDLVERSSSFFAAFTPGHPDLYTDFTTPINILPTLFGGYLGVEVPKQPDTIYAWSDSQFNLFPVEVPGVGPR